MRFYSLCTVLLLCAPALRAQPVPQAAPSKTAVIADDRLRAWLAVDPKVREKINQAQDAAPTAADLDLKDAVADRPVDAQSQRQELMARLPGMKAPRRLGCQDFTTCSVPPLAMDLPAGESVETAIRAMLRPWIWLADARGTRLGVTSAGSDQAVLAINLKELGIAGVELNIAPKPEGGIHLGFSRSLELAEIYSREREALKTQQP